MKKTVIKGASFVFLALMGWACSNEFLDVAPTNLVQVNALNTTAGLEALLIGSYAQLNGRGFQQTASSTNWLYGSILGGDANKGSNAGDYNAITPIMRFEVQSSSNEINQRWLAMYEGISRANAVLRALPNVTVPDASKQRIIGESRFLRGHYYFELKRTFNRVPFIDETNDYDPTTNIVPAVANDADIWPKIEADFQYAYDNLPETQSEAGRANKWAAATYLAKTYLYQKKYTQAKTLFDLIIANGKTTNGKKYGLVALYRDVFSFGNENNEESILSTQNAANTGSSDAASGDLNLNWPYNTGTSGPVGCCGFFQPSFELANSFRTDANGLPLLDGSYNTGANQLVTDQGLESSQAFTPDAGNLDPRLDQSVGRRGIPYLDWQVFPGKDWIRDQAYGGPYSPKKYIYTKVQEGSSADVSNWTKGWTGINVLLIRYADVLLMAAEAEVEVGSLEKARDYVNQVRRRAANAAGFVKTSAGANAAKYVISEFPTSAFASKDAARSAVRFERKLELSGEGHRFFDLVRWGTAATTINAYLTYEGAKLSNALGGAKFTAGKSEYMPIPLTQLDLQKGVLTQNPGY